MALHPVGGRLRQWAPGRFYGSDVGLSQFYVNRSDRLNTATGPFSHVSSFPDGYGIETPWYAAKPGGMAGVAGLAMTAPPAVLTAAAMLSGVLTEGLAGQAALTMEARLLGAATVTAQASASMFAAIRVGGTVVSAWSSSAAVTLSATLSGEADSISTASGDAVIATVMSGATTLAFGGTAGLSGVLTMAGSSPFTLAGSANLGMVVPMSGEAHFSISSDAVMRVKYSMSGTVSSSTELSPQNLAAAVLAAAQAAPIHANTKLINDTPVVGDGSSGNMWRGI